MLFINFLFYLMYSSINQLTNLLIVDQILQTQPHILTFPANTAAKSFYVTDPGVKEIKTVQTISSRHEKATVLAENCFLFIVR